MRWRPTQTTGRAGRLNGVTFIAIPDRAVAFQAYQAGEVDIIQPDPGDVPGIQNDSALSQAYTQYSGACTESYELNLTIPPFDEKLVREAFIYAYDRDAYIRDILQGTSVKTLTWIPPGFPGHDPDETRYDFDPERARTLLAEAGYPNGEGLPEVTLTYVSDDPAAESAATYLVQRYQENLGVTITTSALDGTTIDELIVDVETHPQMVLSSWCAEYPDPKVWLSDYWHSRTDLASSFGYANPEVDRLLDEADRERDEATRLALYQQAQRLIIGDAPQIIRSHSINSFLIKPTFDGFDFTSQDWLFPGQATGLMQVTGTSSE
ncbi:MAG: hypothetical protein HC837_18550 [Chloroflexaceae bacterium]|nr:hypothetical protein [Chloroflexaceae bacterium]